MIIGRYYIGMIRDGNGHPVYYAQNKETKVNVTISHSLLLVIKYIAERR